MTRVFSPLRRRLLWEDPVSCTLPSASHSTASTPILFKHRSNSLLLPFLLFFFSIESSIIASVTAATVVPAWRAFHGAAIVDTSMVIFGGTTDPNTNPYGPTVAGSNDLWVWSTTLRQWSQPPTQFTQNNTPDDGTAPVSGPKPQKFLSSITLQSQGKMLAFVSNSSTGSTRGDLLVLDTNFWIWSIPSSPNSASAPQSRLGAAVGVSHNTVFIHGGAEVTNSDGRPSSSALNDLTRLDDSTFEWTSIANGPALMYHTMCKVPGLNRMIIFGGTDSPNGAFDAVHTFDLNQETWLLNVPINAGNGGATPSARKGHTAVCLNNTMVVYGGGVDGPLDDDVWILDMSSSQWVWNRVVTNKRVGPGPRTGHSALLNGTNMLVWGGYGTPQAGDINIYILDTIAWQWSSSKDLGPEISSSGPPAPSGPGKSSMPLIIGVICGCLALIAAFIGFVVLKKRGSRKGQNNITRSQDNHSYLSDAERHLSMDIDLDDKPNYYHHQSGHDSGSSLGGWPTIAARKSITTTPQGYLMRSMTTLSQQATTDAGSTSENGTNIEDPSGGADTTRREQAHSPKQISQKDVDQSSQRTRPRGGSFTSDPYYPAHLAENDEEDADRWTFASSLSFDQRERAGSVPILRYIPTRNSGVVGLQRSMVHSTGSLTPSYSASRGGRKDAPSSSILSGQNSVTGSPSIAAVGTSSTSQTLSRDGSISPRDTALFNAVSPLDRVSLMCSGLEMESQVPGDDDGLSAKYLHPKSRLPLWRNGSQRENFIEATVDEEEEEEMNTAHKRNSSVSTTNSTAVPATLDHPALLTLVQNLPARYIVSKSPSPIHGTANDILFAVDSDTQQPIVIKSFSRKEAWERECRTLRRLRGPCVVELKHVATLVLSESDEPNKPSAVRLMILERLDETLAQMLKNARKAKKVALREQVATSSSISEAKALDLSGAGLYSSGPALDERYVKDIVKGVLRCLTWCHSKKIVYCDLKPTNIMRNRDDPRLQWKLIDMEASRTAGEECTSVGTIRYCPPEVAMGTSLSAAADSNITRVTAQYSMDLWAFGCLLYELFATRPLIPLSATDEEVLHFLANPLPDTPILPNGLRWTNSRELGIPYFEEAVRDINARNLICTLLRPDPQSRATMDQVLNSAYLRGNAEERVSSSE
ncbi:F-box only protein 42 [Mortierella sp. AM989]|nr:F-box only protein 42 [Mortierella sp. AM989]